MEKPKERIQYETREQYIANAYNCLLGVSELCPMTKEETEVIQNVRAKCLRIFDSLCTEMYDELFED